MIHRHKLAGKVEEVAAAVYRPCCNNHTPFPGCNHGMAMLGLLELMAPQRASADECSVPQNMSTRIVTATNVGDHNYLQSKEGSDFASAATRLVVSDEFSSASGPGMVR